LLKYTFLFFLRVGAAAAVGR